MNLSGVLVISRPESFPAVTKALNEIPGVEVHQQEPITGKLVVVLEAEGIQAEIDLLKRIQSLPGVALAEMVTHYFEEDMEPVDQIPPELESGLGVSKRILSELNA